MKLLLLPSFHWDKVTSKSWQKHQFLINFYKVIPMRILEQVQPFRYWGFEFVFPLRKKPKKMSKFKWWKNDCTVLGYALSNSSQRIPPKKILQKKFSQKIPTKNSQKISKHFLNKFLRFWKYPIPSIAIGGRKPFRACFVLNI